MRIVTGALGVALMAVGGALLLTGGQVKDVAIWLAGSIVLHDGIIAPLVLATGLLLAAVPSRGTVRAALLVAGCLTAIALPALLAPGNPTNPSVLPLDYLLNWLILLGAVGVGAGVLVVVRGLRGRRMRRR